MSDSFLSDYLRTRSRVDQLERIESGGGGSAGAVYLTLTRTAIITIATTGTVITWQSEVRGNGFTWSGTTITIPSDGYYAIDFAFELNSFASYTVDFIVNTVDVGRLATYDSGSVRFRAVGTRYFSEGDALEIKMVVGAARNVLVNAYDTSWESPFLHIIKVA
jgi:hypothetical protein